MIGERAADAIGFVGAVTILGGFAYQTVRDARPDTVSNGLNFAGAALLAVSLSVNVNLPSLCLELCWAAIALFGLARPLLRGGRSR